MVSSAAGTRACPSIHRRYSRPGPMAPAFLPAPPGSYVTSRGRRGRGTSRAPTPAHARRWERPPAAVRDPVERMLVRAVDELYTDAVVSDSTWRELSSRFEARQMLDILTTVGGYRMVSMALNTFGVQLEPDAERFPAALR